MVNGDGLVLLGRRGSLSTHSKGTWGLPGGKLDFGETLAECAQRETLEEAGIEIGLIDFMALTNDVFTEGQRHFITIFMVASHQSGQPQLMEKNKMESWGWYHPESLPTPLFSPIMNLFSQGIDLKVELQNRNYI